MSDSEAEDVGGSADAPPPPPGGGAFKASKPRDGPKRKKPPRIRRKLTLAHFRQLEAVLKNDGYADMIAWSESIQCGSAWKRDPGSGVIGVEKGPLIPVV